MHIYRKPGSRRRSRISAQGFEESSEASMRRLTWTPLCCIVRHHACWVLIMPIVHGLVTTDSMRPRTSIWTVEQAQAGTSSWRSRGKMEKGNHNISIYVSCSWWFLFYFSRIFNITVLNQRNSLFLYYRARVLARVVAIRIQCLWKTHFTIWHRKPEYTVTPDTFFNGEIYLLSKFDKLCVDKPVYPCVTCFQYFNILLSKSNWIICLPNFLKVNTYALFYKNALFVINLIMNH